MPFQLEWLVPNQVLVNTVSGTISVQDIVQMATDGAQMVLTSHQDVYCIVDIAQLERFPTNFMDIANIRRKIVTNPTPKWIIIVGIPNRFVQFIMEALNMLIQSNYIALRNWDEIHHFVEKQDPMLAQRLNHVAS